MSVVIVGGNERMEENYRQICRQAGCRARVFTKENGTLKKKLGTPDLLIVMTGTVSHKMSTTAVAEAKRCRVPVEWVHSSSGSALRRVLENYRVHA